MGCRPVGLVRWVGLLAMLGWTMTALAAPAVGSVPPDFTLAGMEQSEVQLARLQGKVVVIEFWASWCPACQQSMPWLERLQARYGVRGLQVVAINVDQKREDADAWLVAHPLKLLLAFDPANRTPRSYDLSAMPATLVIGADGKVRAAHEGFEPADIPALEMAVKAALGAPVP